MFRGYARRAENDPNFRVMALVDNDGGDCAVLKKQMEDIAANAGLLTKAQAGAGGSFEEREPYRAPEQNRAWETLQRLLNEHGYYEGVEPFPKPEIADRVARHMNVEIGVNRSASFTAFIEGLRACV